MKNYTQYSFWLETAGEPLVPRPSLQRSAETDVAIIGAGFTGLWTAYYLSLFNPNLKIAVIEKEIVGYGASGRNGGWCSTRFPLTPAMLKKRCGAETARALLLAMYDAVDEIGRVCETEGIDAHFHKGGILSLARGAHQLPSIRSAYAAYDSLGLGGHHQMLTPEQVAERVRVTGVEGGLYTSQGASVHPGRLVRGLGRAAERRGITIYEQTPLVEFRPQSTQVIVPGGALRTRVAVVFALESYLAGVAGFRRSVVPMYSLITLTEPLSDGQLQTIGWSSRESLASNRYSVDYLTLTADRRILFGGRGAPYVFGSKISDEQDHHGPTHERLRRSITEWFPALSGIQCTHNWGGPVGMPRDWMPSVQFDPRSKMAFAYGYTGQGVTTANLVARSLAGLIVGKKTGLEALPFLQRRSPNWEMEPLRWLAIRYLQNAFLRIDSALDAEKQKPADAPLAEYLGRH